MKCKLPELTFDINEAQIRERLIAEATRSIHNICDSYFQREQRINGKIFQSAGVGTLYIQSEFDKLLEKYESSGKLQEMIEKAFEASLEKAINLATDHTAKSLAFTKIKLVD